MPPHVSFGWSTPLSTWRERYEAMFATIAFAVGHPDIAIPGPLISIFTASLGKVPGHFARLELASGRGPPRKGMLVGPPQGSESQLRGMRSGAIMPCKNVTTDALSESWEGIETPLTYAIP